MHVQQLTVGNINLQVINFFLQLLNQEERDRVEKVHSCSVAFTIKLFYTSKYTASTGEEILCKENGMYLIFYEAVQRWKRCGKASKTLAGYVKVSLYCFKLLSIFNTPFQIFVRVSKGVTGLLVMPVECKEHRISQAFESY